MASTNFSWIFTIFLIGIPILLVLNETGIFVLSTHQTIFVLFILAILQIIKSILDSSQMEKIQDRLDSVKQHLSSLFSQQEKSEIERKKSEMFYQNQTKKFEEFKIETEETQEIIGELIRKGVISNDDVISGMNDVDIFMVYCYANRAIKSTILPNSRSYPKLLEQLGFTRLPYNSPVFITTSDILDGEYQSTRKLRKLLLTKIRTNLKEEYESWKQILISSGIPQSYTKQTEFVNSSFADTMHLNLLVVRGKLNDQSFGAVNNVVLPDSVMNLFRRYSSLHGVSLQEEKKTNILNFVKKISLIDFIEVSSSSKSILSSNESHIKDSLGINQFTDYAHKKDLLLIELKKYFNDDKALDIRDKVVSKSKAFNNVLKKLSIS